LAVGIVAVDAAQSSPAGAVAAAGVHLLDVAERRVTAASMRAGDEDSQEVLQRQSGAVISRTPTGSLDVIDPLEVALLADGLPQRGLEAPRIDDCRVVGAVARAGREGVL